MFKGVETSGGYSVAIQNRLFSQFYPHSAKEKVTGDLSGYVPARRDSQIRPVFTSIVSPQALPVCTHTAVIGQQMLSYHDLQMLVADNNATSWSEEPQARR